jgi:hypothetical protein
VLVERSRRTLHPDFLETAQNAIAGFIHSYLIAGQADAHKA